MDYITTTYQTKFAFEASHDVPWHPTLITLINWIHEITAYDLFFVSTRRPGDKGVHGTDPLRGVDLQRKGKSGKKLVEFINQYWEYDSSRPKIMVATLFRDRIHLRIHDKTIIKRGGYQITWKGN